MEQPPLNDPTPLSPELQAFVRSEIQKGVRAYMEQEHACDLSSFDPDELIGIIRQFDDDEMRWGKRMMLDVVNQYGPNGKQRGRDDLQQMATRLLRIIDKEDGLDWKRHLTRHEQKLLSRGGAIELTRRSFVGSIFAGAIAGGFLYSGTVHELAAQYGVHSSVAAPKEQDAFRRALQSTLEASEAVVDPKAEIAVGALIAYDAWKEWRRVKRELVVEKLEHLADSLQELYDRTQNSALFQSR